jgi:hypothetical protein
MSRSWIWKAPAARDGFLASPQGPQGTKPVQRVVLAATGGGRDGVAVHHFTEACPDDLAIESWGEAGDQALRRSAIQEAIAHRSIGRSEARANMTRPLELGLLDERTAREKAQTVSRLQKPLSRADLSQRVG